MSERFKVGDLVRCRHCCFAGTPEVYLDVDDLGIVTNTGTTKAYEHVWQYMEVHHQRLSRIEVVFKRDWLIVE
jgi:hypothetical protein